MSLLEKIVYIADYIEPARDHAPNLDEVRQLAFQDLDDALLKILEEDELENYYVTAGCINQTVFNYYHDYEIDYGIKDYDIVYFDRYDITKQLSENNVIGVLLGNGLQNCPGGYIWDFDTASFRDVPKICFELERNYFFAFTFLLNICHF